MDDKFLNLFLKNDYIFLKELQEEEFPSKWKEAIWSLSEKIFSFTLGSGFLLFIHFFPFLEDKGYFVQGSLWCYHGWIHVFKNCGNYLDYLRNSEKNSFLLLENYARGFDEFIQQSDKFIHQSDHKKFPFTTVHSIKSALKIQKIRNNILTENNFSPLTSFQTTAPSISSVSSSMSSSMPSSMPSSLPSSVSSSMYSSVPSSVPFSVSSSVPSSMSSCEHFNDYLSFDNSIKISSLDLIEKDFPSIQIEDEKENQKEKEKEKKIDDEELQNEEINKNYGSLKRFKKDDEEIVNGDSNILLENDCNFIQPKCTSSLKKNEQIKHQSIVNFLINPSEKLLEEDSQLKIKRNKQSKTSVKSQFQNWGKVKIKAEEKIKEEENEEEIGIIEKDTSGAISEEFMKSQYDKNISNKLFQIQKLKSKECTHYEYLINSPTLTSSAQEYISSMMKTIYSNSFTEKQINIAIDKAFKFEDIILSSEEILQFKKNSYFFFYDRRKRAYSNYISLTSEIIPQTTSENDEIDQLAGDIVINDFACRMNSACVSEACVERLFSDVGRILSIHRLNMIDDTLLGLLSLSEENN